MALMTIASALVRSLLIQYLDVFSFHRDVCCECLGYESLFNILSDFDTCLFVVHDQLSNMMTQLEGMGQVRSCLVDSPEEFEHQLYGLIFQHLSMVLDDPCEELKLA